MPDKATNMDVEILDVQAVNKKENRSFTAKRIKVHPKRVYGSFRAFKWGMMAFTLGIYYLTPWLRWDRGASAPDQAVLIDIPGGGSISSLSKSGPRKFTTSRDYW